MDDDAKNANDDMLCVDETTKSKEVEVEVVMSDAVQKVLDNIDLVALVKLAMRSPLDEEFADPKCENLIIGGFINALQRQRQQSQQTTNVTALLLDDEDCLTSTEPAAKRKAKAKAAPATRVKCASLAKSDSNSNSNSNNKPQTETETETETKEGGISIEKFHVMAGSDRPNNYASAEDYAGILFYQHSGQLAWTLNGVKCAAGYIFVKQAANVMHHGSVLGVVHGNVHMDAFGVEAKIAETVAIGFTFVKGRQEWCINNSGEFNSNPEMDALEKAQIVNALVTWFKDGTRDTVVKLTTYPKIQVQVQVQVQCPNEESENTTTDDDCKNAVPAPVPQPQPQPQMDDKQEVGEIEAGAEAGTRQGKKSDPSPSTIVKAKAKAVPVITSLKWGEMVIGFNGELVAFKDCILSPVRAENWDWANDGTHHSPGITIAAVSQIIDECDIVILTKGMALKLQVAPKTITYLQERKDTSFYILETKAAAKKYEQLVNENHGRVGGLFHSTC